MLLLALKSRTIWTILALFVLNGLQGVIPMLHGGFLTAANVILSILAIYYKLNPSQNYMPPQD